MYKENEVNRKFISELYHGKINVSELKFENDSLYHSLILKRVELEEKILKTLDTEQTKLFNEYGESLANPNSLWYEECFSVGFKMGVKMMSEVLCSDKKWNTENFKLK